ncbi:MAG: cysteine desulfurase [Eubacterium sp.]|nr:cysteine desulfurase [Eubacterium sp.]
MKEIYLDNAATTLCSKEAAEAVQSALTAAYGNPSSMHAKGVEAEKILRDATRALADILKVKEKEIFYTSGGTESDNWALVGTTRANARRGRHIITTAIEHPAVSAPLEELKEEGFEITILPVDSVGRVTAEQVVSAIREDTILVSVMMVNNEIGTIEPVAEIGEAIHRKDPGIFFHVDAVQAFGKLPVYPKRMHIDMLSVSGHKIHGPKGIGLLFIDERVRIRPLILGGGQQKGMRSGTDNVPGIAGLAAAAEKIWTEREKNIEQMSLCRKKLIAGLKEMEDVVIHGPEDAVPYIVNASFLGIRSEVLLHALESKGIYVSSGSACSSHKRAGSPVLTAIRCAKEEMDSAVRFSFSGMTQEAEIEETLDALREMIPVLRRFVRK